ncbi:MAG TPA: TonB-dependent receptor [Granulicella sp.]
MSRMSNRFLPLFLIGFVLGILFVPSTLSPVMDAQGIITGSLTGFISDSTGAAVVNASVTAENENTKGLFKTVTGSDGTFTLRDLPVGSYTVTITNEGFSKDTIKQALVTTGNTTSIGNQKLQPSSMTETVQVAASSAALLDTVSSQGSATIEAKELQELPVYGGFDTTALLVPGIVSTHSNGDAQSNGTDYSSNGLRSRSNNSELDGQANDDLLITGPQIYFSNQDALQEIQVISNNFSAQYGRNAGSIVNYITKSGTNEFHGSGFEFYTSTWLSSLTQGQKGSQFGYCTPGQDVSSGCIKPAVPGFVQNAYGGTLGGPIIKNKLFFFGSTYWVRTYQGATRYTSAPTVFPDSVGLAQLQQSFPSNPGTQELVKQGPFAYSAGNPTSFGPTQNVLVTDGITTQSIEMAQVARNVANIDLDQEDMGRLDFQPTERDHFYLRYIYQDTPLIAYFGNLVAGTSVNVQSTTHSIGGDWTHTFSPHWVDQLRYSFQQARLGFDGGGVPTCTIGNLSTCPSSVGFGSSYLQIGYPAGQPTGRIAKVTQVQNNATASVGRQSISFGGEFDYQNNPNINLPNGAGVFDFTPGDATFPLRNTTADTYNGYTALLEGVSSTSLTAGNATTHFQAANVFLYVQDDIKARPNLTLNVGLRYEYFGQAVNALHNETVAQQTGPNPFWNTSLPLSATTFPKVDNYWKNIEPRLGFSFNPDIDKGLVIRGGFAINADPSFNEIFLTAASGSPVVNSGTFSCDGQTVNCLPGGGFTYAAVHALDDPLIPSGGDPRFNLEQDVPTNFRPAFVETWTLGIQHQVGRESALEIRYVGNHAMHEFQRINSNPYLGSASTCTDPTTAGYLRLDCTHYLHSTVANTAFSQYNGLQTSFTTRSLHNWSGSIAYTYSRAIDNASEIDSTFGGGTTTAYAQNPLNLSIGERGVNGQSYTHAVASKVTFTSPFFKEEKGILGRILGGYRANALYTYNSGQPFTPYQSAASQSLNAVPTPPLPSDPKLVNSNCDLAFNTYFNSSFDVCRPILSNPKAPIGSVGINTGHGYMDYTVVGKQISRSDVHWLYNNQYEEEALGNPYPGVGRNTLRGQPWNSMDASIYKDIRLKRNITLQLQMTAFNVLNHAYFGTPDALLDDALKSGFLNHHYSTGSTATFAANGAIVPPPGNRNIQLGGELRF